MVTKGIVIVSSVDRRGSQLVFMATLIEMAKKVLLDLNQQEVFFGYISTLKLKYEIKVFEKYFFCCDMESFYSDARIQIIIFRETKCHQMRRFIHKG